MVEEVAKGSHDLSHLPRPSTVPDRLSSYKRQVAGHVHTGVHTSMCAQAPVTSVRWSRVQPRIIAYTNFSHHVPQITPIHHSDSQCGRLQRTPEKLSSRHIKAPAARPSTSTTAALSPLRPAPCNPPIVRSRATVGCRPQATVLEPSTLLPAEALWQTVAARAAWNRGSGGFDAMREPEFLQAAEAVDTLAELSAAVHAAHTYGAPAVEAPRQEQQQLGWPPAAGSCPSTCRGGVRVSDAPVHIVPQQARDNVLRGFDPSRTGARNAQRSAFGQARPPRAAAPVAALRAPAAACGVGSFLAAAVRPLCHGPL